MQAKILNTKFLDYSEIISCRLQKYVPLLKKYKGISAFGYMKLFPGNRFIISSSETFLNRRIFEFLVSNNAVLFYGNLLDKVQNKYIVIWPKNPYHAFMNLFIDIGYWNGMNIIEFKENHIEMSWFVLKIQDSQMSEHYITEYKDLMKLSSHFMRENSDVLGQTNHYRASPFIAYGPYLKENDLESTFKQKQLKTKQFFDSILNPSINLSKQEYRCVEILAQGRTMKEIAQTLKLSPRTVEGYIGNVKIKTGCNFKSQILDLFFGNKFAMNAKQQN